jgi:hypothetical protein
MNDFERPRLGRFLFWTFFGVFWTIFDRLWTFFLGFWTFLKWFWTIPNRFWTIRHFLETPPIKKASSPQRELAQIFYFCKVALIKSRNSGCGRVGLETNSGWNCDATNHGWSLSSTISTRRPSGLVPENTNPASSIS